ncbi:hypothetical protein I552_7714 [Mycobacterium xenopi 3993]|nr:hypothetical protein I552_7714 [Mycobacterium xenopi 3993]
MSRSSAGPEHQWARAAALGAGQGVLVDNGAGTWLLWDGRRSRIDLADRAVTNALGLGTDVPAARPIAPGLFNAIPETPALTPPAIPDAGTHRISRCRCLPRSERWSWLMRPTTACCTTRFCPTDCSRSRRCLPRSCATPIPMAWTSRPAGCRSGCAAPVSRILDTSRYPDQRISLVDAARAPVTCAYWSKPAGLPLAR